MIPITKVDVTESESLVLEVLRSGNLAQGPKVAELEQAFSQLIGVEHTVAVNNGTTALVAALQALGLSEGDEVITSPFTFVATLNAALEAGLRVKFADISPSDFCVIPESIEEKVSEHTRVLMPVHLYGQCADMDAIQQIADKHGMRIIEDAAQAHGAKINGRFAGTFDVGCFSLYATKNVTSGEGGLITTNDGAVAERLRILRNQGMKQRYQYEVPGHNYRMTDLQAAIAIPQIARIHEIADKREQNAKRLIEGLRDISGITVPSAKSGRRHVWHQFTILLDESVDMTQETFVSRLAAEGVACGVYYPRLVFDYACFRDNPMVVPDEFPSARSIAGRCVSLPVHQHLTQDDIEAIIVSVRRVLVGS